MLDHALSEAREPRQRRSGRFRPLTILRALGEAVSQSLDLDEVLERSLSALGQITGHEIASLHLLDADGERLLLKADRGLSPRLREVNLMLPLGRGLIGGVARTGVPRRVDDVSAARDLLPEARPVVARDGIRAFVCVPVRARRRTLGTLSLGRRTGRRFTDREVMLLECAADQVGLALDNARLHGETRRQLGELERARTAVARAERLSAVTELASGVAHELNNPLTIVLAQAQLLGQAEGPEALQRGLRVIEAAARRAAGVVRDLGLFAEPRRAERAPCDLRALVERVLDLYQPRFAAERIQARVEGDPLPQVWGDAEQLQQVLAALVENARQAMVTAHGGGSLLVRLRRSHLGVTVEVADDGPGIAPEHLPRIFTPFFTTKSPGAGRGLGLAIAHGIVREHGGRIWGDNRAGGGAVFVMELPLDLRRNGARG